MSALIQRLSDCIRLRLEDDHAARMSGFIIDTPASFSVPAASAGANDVKHPLVKACVEALHVNVVIVIGNEKLYIEMQRMFDQHRDISVVKIPKSGGVVELEYNYRERVHNYQIRSYFYGPKIDLPPGVTDATLGGEALSDLTLAPYSTVVSFTDLVIYRIGGAESLAPSSALPIGAQRTISELQPILVDPAQPGSGLLNSVLAILSNVEESENIVETDVAGFAVVTALDITARKMTILSPVAGSLAGRKALLGSFEWQES